MAETFINSEIATLKETNKCKEYKSSSSTSEENKKNSSTESPEAASAAEVKYDLSKFRLERILNNNTRNKSISLLGDFPDVSVSDKAIVILEKQAFQDSDVATNANVHEHENGNSNEAEDIAQTAEKNIISVVDVATNANAQKENSGNNQEMKGSAQSVEKETITKPSYFCNDLKVRTEFINNIYGSYLCFPTPNLSGVKATVVYPATDKHIEKYSICQKFIINETPELYKEITLPYITSSQFSLEWVYNILEHKQEAERIIFEDADPDNGFILLPDLKWDGHNVENLYMLAITHKRDIKSLRDLNSSHLPLLRNIRDRAAEAIASRYDILATQLRVYFHYQPTFYHLHVHINPIRNEAPGIWCEKSHMLDTVINNLELLPDYYQNATLPFVLFDGNKLLELYETKMTIRRNLNRRLPDDVDNGKDDIPTKRLEIDDEITKKDNESTEAMTN